MTKKKKRQKPNETKITTDSTLDGVTFKNDLFDLCWL